MSVVEPSSGGDVPVIPDGTYDARITAVKDVQLETPDMHGNTEKVEITVHFEDDDGEEHELDPRVNRKWGELATLFKIAEAAGLNPNPDAAFDTDYLKNRKVRVVVETKEEGKWPRVTKWMKARANGAKQASAPPVASQVPSMINIDGTLNTTAFWTACKAAGIPNTEVAEAVGGDLMKLATIDPTEIVAMYEILKARHEGEADVPFEG